MSAEPMEERVCSSMMRTKRGSEVIWYIPFVQKNEDFE